MPLVTGSSITAVVVAGGGLCVPSQFWRKNLLFRFFVSSLHFSFFLLFYLFPCFPVKFLRDEGACGALMIIHVATAVVVIFVQHPIQYD